MAKRLYQITDTATRSPVEGFYFADKMAAKVKRRALNDNAGTQLRFVVSPGPDHRNYRK